MYLLFLLSTYLLFCLILKVLLIESVPNAHSPPCILLCETFRQKGKVRHRTLANLSKRPKPIVEGLRALLKVYRDPATHLTAAG